MHSTCLLSAPINIGAFIVLVRVLIPNRALSAPPSTFVVRRAEVLADAGGTDTRQLAFDLGDTNCRCVCISAWCHMQITYKRK